MSASVDHWPLTYEPCASGVSACQWGVASSCTMTLPSVSRIMVLVLNFGWLFRDAQEPTINVSPRFTANTANDFRELFAGLSSILGRPFSDRRLKLLGWPIVPCYFSHRGQALRLKRLRGEREGFAIP